MTPYVLILFLAPAGGELPPGEYLGMRTGIATCDAAARELIEDYSVGAEIHCLPLADQGAEA